MPTLLDQRTMHGGNLQWGVEQVRDFWDLWTNNERRRAAGRPDFAGFPQRDGALEWERSDLTPIAYVNEGRWVADCPAEGCNGGIACWPEHREAACLDCGRIFTVKFPTPRQVSEAEAVLALRVPANRHWRPDTGESAKALRHENITRGFAIPH